MKWVQHKGNPIEYSTGYVGQRNYISMSHTNYNDHYWYTYTSNGVEVLHGGLVAGNWEEAQNAAIDDIREKMEMNVLRWKRILEDFVAEVDAHEALD